jgi:uncharacterized protein DUF4232
MRLPVKFAFAVGSMIVAVLGIGAAAGATEANPSPPTLAAAPPCESSALALRQVTVGRSPGEALFVVENSGDKACRIIGSVGIRLFDESGTPIPLKFAPRTLMAMLLTLEPSAEASFTVTFAAQPPERCATAARVEVFLTGQTAPLSTTTSLLACTAGPVRVSNLRLGVPAPLHDLVS